MLKPPKSLVVPIFFATLSQVLTCNNIIFIYRPHWRVKIGLSLHSAIGGRIVFYITASLPKKNRLLSSFPASTCEDGRKYVRGRSQVRARTDAGTCVRDGQNWHWKLSLAWAPMVLRKQSLRVTKNGELMLSEIESSYFIREICPFGISNIG